MKPSWRIAAGTALTALAIVAVAVAERSGNRTQSPAAALEPSAPAVAVSADGGTAASTSNSAFGALGNLALQPTVAFTPGYLSQPLRSVPAVVGPVVPRPEYIEPRGERPATPRGAAVTDPVVQKTFGPLAMPASTSFAGLSNQDNATLFGTSSRPPDTDGDVGPNHYVEWTNVALRIFNKSGTSVLGPIAGNAVFAGLPPTSLCRTTNDGDPLVAYDQLANRWVLSQFAFAGAAPTTGPYEQCVAVSTTDDPTGTYCLYEFTVSNTDFNDYGKIGVWPDGYYFSFGMFAGGAAYSGPGAMVVERPKMLQAGCPAAKSAFYQIPNSAHPEGLPSDVDGPNPPPAGRPNFFLFPNLTDNGIELWKFQVVDWTQAVPVTTFTKNATDISVPPYDPFVSCTPTSRSCVPQAGTPNKLDLVGDRFMWRLAYRNWGATPPTGIPANTESLVTNETVDANDPNPNHVAVRWYEIRAPNGSPTAFQASTYAPDSDHRWMASAAQDGAGNLAVGFTTSGSIFPTPRYAGRLVGDPINTLAQGEATMFAPLGPAPVATGTAGDQRWGDYSNLTLDPLDDCTFWYVSEYMSTTPLSIDSPNVLRNWQTRIGKFKFTQCGGTTAVSVRSFSASWRGSAVRVDWRTASEVDTLGFDVYRSAGAGPFRKLNGTLIRAKKPGSAHGASYRFLDLNVRPSRTYTYRLRLVSASGKRTWYGAGSAATG